MILGAIASVFAKPTHYKLFLGIAICFLFSLFWSFQPVGTGHDIDNYYSAFINSPNIFEYKYTTNYGQVYYFLMSLMNTVGFGFTGFQFITLFTASLLYLFAFRKLTDNYVYGTVITLLLADTFISLIRLHRQGLAVSFLFLSFAYLFTNKKFRSIVIIPIIASLHITFLPVYLMFLGILKTIKKSLFTKTVILFTVISTLLYLLFNPLFFLDVLGVTNIDSIYISRARKYLDLSRQSGLNFGLGFMLLASIFLTYTVHDRFFELKQFKRFRKNVYLKKITWYSMLSYFLIIIIFSGFDVVGRLALYFSPFFALGLVLMISTMKNYERLLFAMISLFLLGSFLLMRIYSIEPERIPFNHI